MIDFDFEAFENAIYEAARLVFPNVQRDRSDETFYTFNFATGDTTQDVYILVNTEEELERRARSAPRFADRYNDVPFDDLKTFLRHQHHVCMIVDQNSDSEFAKNFESVNDMLWTQWNQIEEFSLEFLDDEDNDEDDFDDAVYDAYHEPVESSLKNVLRRLDKEIVFEMTNKRENIHLGVLQGSWRYDEMLQ